MTKVGTKIAMSSGGGDETPGAAFACTQSRNFAVEVFELRHVIRMKVANGGDVFIQTLHSSLLTTGVVSKDIRAYRPDGKPADPQEVLRALVKPRGVAYYLGYDKAKPVQPDPFYLGMLREGSIVLAFDRPELAPPVPAPAKP
jgi:hypothetical protein